MPPISQAERMAAIFEPRPFDPMRMANAGLVSGSVSISANSFIEFADECFVHHDFEGSGSEISGGDVDFAIFEDSNPNIVVNMSVSGVGDELGVGTDDVRLFVANDAFGEVFPSCPIHPSNGFGRLFFFAIDQEFALAVIDDHSNRIASL